MIAYCKTYQGLFGVDMDKGADHRQIATICPAIRVLRTGEGSEQLGIQNPSQNERVARFRVWCFDKAVEQNKEFKAADAYDKINLLEKKLKEALSAWVWDSSNNAGDFDGYSYNVTVTSSGFNEMSFLPAVGSYFDLEIEYLKG